MRIFNRLVQFSRVCWAEHCPICSNFWEVLRPNIFFSLTSSQLVPVARKAQSNYFQVLVRKSRGKTFHENVSHIKGSSISIQTVFEKSIFLVVSWQKKMTPLNFEGTNQAVYFYWSALCSFELKKVFRLSGNTKYGHRKFLQAENSILILSIRVSPVQSLFSRDWQHLIDTWHNHNFGT